MVANKQGKRQIRLAVNNVSRFSPRTARKTLELPRHGLARTIERVATASLPTDCGEFRIIGYPSLSSDQEFVTLVRGEPQPDRPTPGAHSLAVLDGRCVRLGQMRLRATASSCDAFDCG